MHIVGKSTNTTWKGDGIRLNVTISISRPCPTIIYIDCKKDNYVSDKSMMHDEQTICITSFSETSWYNYIGCSFKQLFIDFTLKTIPTIPTCNRNKPIKKIQIIFLNIQFHFFIPIWGTRPKPLFRPTDISTKRNRRRIDVVIIIHSCTKQNA